MSWRKRNCKSAGKRAYSGTRRRSTLRHAAGKTSARRRLRRHRCQSGNIVKQTTPAKAQATKE
jgi:hypothetical protein